MDRRKVIAAGIASGLVSGIAAAAGPAFAQGDDYRDEPKGGDGSDYGHAPGDRDRPYGGPADHPVGTYSRDEIVHNVSDFFGVTAENAGAVIEKVFHENGRPTAYIAGQEGSGAFFFGLRYGKRPDVHEGPAAHGRVLAGPHRRLRLGRQRQPRLHAVLQSSVPGRRSSAASPASRARPTWSAASA